ncbi:MAG: hypothetical protein BWY79_01919 [Actinobacteria bacterium ADurb.Bin444]|nr:MAG: hypothetical protein BWY79_01919 [Actinobacteria bacterium ADurb.Bin444]
MAQHQKVGAGQAQGQPGDGFPQDAPCLHVTQAGHVLLPGAALLGLPRLRPHRSHNGELHLLVVLEQSRESRALKHGIGVLKAVSQGAGGGIHQQVLILQPQSREKDIQLLGQVHVYGGRRDDRMPVTQSRRSHSPVVVFLGQSQQSTPLPQEWSQGLGHLSIRLRVTRAEHRQRHINRFGHFRRNGRRFSRRPRRTVGIGTHQPQIDQLRPKCLHHKPRPCSGVIPHAGVNAGQRRRPIGGRNVPDFKADPGQVGEFSLKAVERQHHLATEAQTLQHQLRHPASGGLHYCLKRHRQPPLFLPE